MGLHVHAVGRSARTKNPHFLPSDMRRKGEGEEDREGERILVLEMRPRTCEKQEQRPANK